MPKKKIKQKKVGEKDVALDNTNPQLMNLRIIP